MAHLPPLLLLLLMTTTMIKPRLAHTATNSTTTSTTTVDLSSYVDVLDRAAPIVGLVYGPVLCFFGLAWYVAVAQVLGFLAGGALFALAALLLAQCYTTAAVVFMTAAFVCGGACIGALFRLRPAICTFAIGAAVGVMLTYGAFAVAGLALNNDASPLLFAVAFPLSIAMGVCAVHYEPPAVLASTSVFGAYSWLYGVGYYAGAFPTWRAVYERMTAESSVVVPWTWWLYLVTFVALVVWSVRVQYQQLRTRSEKPDSGAATPAWTEMEAARGTEATGRGSSGATTPRRSPVTPSAPYQRVQNACG